MSSLSQVLLLSLLPGVGNFLGGVAAEVFDASPRALNWALHSAAGIVIGIVALELMPEAVAGLTGVVIAAAFAAGGIVYVLIESGVEALQGSDTETRTGMWMVYVAVAVDLASDGMMIGSGYTVSASLAFALAGGQVLADLPEGYAAAANFRRKKVPRRRRLMLSASFMLYVIVAAVGAFTFLRNTSRTVQLAVLVFIAGLLVVAAVEDMLREAHGAREDTRRSVLAFVGGFSLFALVSAGFDR